MKCPTCRSRDLAVEVTLRGMIACRFHNGEQFDLLQPSEFHSSWDDSSPVVCLKCSWSGTALDATRKARAPAGTGSRPARSRGRGTPAHQR